VEIGFFIIALQTSLNQAVIPLLVRSLHSQIAAEFTWQAGNRSVASVIGEHHPRQKGNKGSEAFRINDN
jgi:nicotinamide riboside transporter PnuC